MAVKAALSFLLDLLFPPRCIFCGQVIPPGRAVCEKCAAGIETLSGAVSLNTGHAGNNIPCTVLYAYDGKVRDSIIRFKFGGEKKNSVFYAENLSALIEKSYGKDFFSTVTCVPISSERKKSRGYNQSELVARGVSSFSGIPYSDCLIKIKDNPEQHFLSNSERKSNVKGVYRLSGTDIKDKKVLLIDDIVTTGSTISECAKVLRSGGAEVYCAAVALAKMQY